MQQVRRYMGQGYLFATSQITLFPSYPRTSRLSIGFARKFSQNRGVYASIFVMCLIIMDKDFSLKNS